MAKANIDQTGAPIAIRMQLSSAPQGQRKDILSKYFPQAFTAAEMLEANPDLDIEKLGGNEQLFYLDNNVMKLVDPPGFIQSVFPPKIDVGDIAEAGRDVVSTIGGGLGGTAAFLAGQAGPQIATPEEIYTVPLAAALGAETAGQLYDTTMSMFTPGGIDRGGPVQQLGQAAQNLSTEFAGGRLGDMATRGVKTAIQKGTQRLSGISPGQRADDFANLGIDGTAATLTGRPSVANLEESLGGSLFAADIIGASRDKLLKQLTDTTDKIAKKFGSPAGSKEEVGAVIRQGALASFDKIEAKKTQLYDEAYNAASGINVNFQNLRTLKAELETELAQAPESLKGSLGPAIAQIDVILKDAAQNNGLLPLQAIRSVRTALGKTIGKPVPGAIRVMKQGDERLPSIYKAVTDDIGASVSNASPNAARLLRKADDYTRYTAKENLAVINTISKRGLDSQVFDFAIFGSTKGGQRIREVFKNLGRDERDAVSASVISQLGYRGNASEGAEWSARTFLTNWQRLDKNAKQVLFGAPRFREVAKELNSLARLAKVTAERGAADNVSRSGAVLTTAGQIFPLLAAGGLAIYDQPEAAKSAFAIGASTILAPRYAAKLMTSPKFLRWIKSTAQVANKGVNPLSVQLGRLAALPGKDGELGEAVNAFVLNLQDSITGQ
tara:strand:- start:51 stop:2051 length:2001 start_codon:yes stop_codon:yes gene_type:complete